jgi:hypothetical protein
MPRSMRTVLTLLIMFLCAVPAQAAPRALALVGEDEGFALAGDRVLYTQTEGRTVRVLSVPLSGGKARTLFTHKVKPGRFAYGEQLVASPERAALLVGAFNKSGESETTQVFSGTASGGWDTLIPPRGLTFEAPFPNGVQLAGDDVVTFERVGLGALDYQVALYEPARRVLSLPLGTLFAGDFALYTERDDDQPESKQRVTVVNWRTSQPLSVAEFPEPVGNVQIERSGRALVTVGKTLYAVRPGGAVDQVAQGQLDSAWVVGDRVLSNADDGVRVHEPDGTTRRFGIRTYRLERFIADDRNVLWSANGCLMVAPVTDGAAREPGPGPCARSELTVGHRKLNAKGNANFELRCISAPAGGCRGTLELGVKGAVVAGASNLRVPVGARRELIVRLTKTERLKLTRAKDASITLRPTVGPRQTLVSGFVFWCPPARAKLCG